MLRPDTVVSYAKQRAARRLSDLDQLLNGLNVGGRLIVGGDEKAASVMRSVATQQRRLGTIIALKDFREKELDPFMTYSFDVIAVAQLIMIAKNEAFHQSIDQAINVIQKIAVEDGQKVEMALQVLREQADQVGHL